MTRSSEEYSSGLISQLSYILKNLDLFHVYNSAELSLLVVLLGPREELAWDGQVLLGITNRWKCPNAEKKDCPFFVSYFKIEEVFPRGTIILLCPPVSHWTGLLYMLIS